MDASLASVVPSDLVTVDDRPTSPSQVWDLSSLFLASWAEGIVMESMWDTYVSRGQSAAEKRWAVAGKPERTLQVTLYGWGQGQVWSLMNATKRSQFCRTLFPLYCDSATVTDLATATSTGVLSCSAAHKRFFPGGRVVVGSPARSCGGLGPICDVTETAIIASVADDAITLTAPLSGAWSGLRYAVVWPLMEVDVVQQVDLTAETDRHAKVALTLKEVPGQSALPPWADQTDLPLTWGTYGGRPVFDPSFVDPDNEQPGWRRELIGTGSGVGTEYTPIGSRPKVHRHLGKYAYDRKSTSEVLSLFDAVSGNVMPFIVAAGVNPFAVVSLTTTQVQVVAQGPASDWQDYPYFAVKGAGDVMQVSAISSVSRSGSVDTVSFADAITMPTTPLVRATHAFLARFENNTLQESWETNIHAAVEADVIEVLVETDVTVIDLPGGGPDGTCQMTYIATVSGNEHLADGTYALTWNDDSWTDDSGLMSLGGTAGDWSILYEGGPGNLGSWTNTADTTCPPTGVYAGDSGTLTVS